MYSVDNKVITCNNYLYALYNAKLNIGYCIN